MHTLSSPPLGSGQVSLEREDLIAYEHHLHRAFRRILSFSAHSLHFPADVPGRKVWLDSAESSVFIPLFSPEGGHDEGRLLGVSQLRAVETESVTRLADALPGMAAIAVEALLFHKRSLTDAVTGLHTRQHLLDTVAGQIDGMRGYDEADPGKGVNLGSGATNFAIVCIRLDSLRDVVREHGYLSGDQVASSAAAAIVETAGDQGLCARVSDSEVAIFLPGAAGTTARKLGEALAARLAIVTVPDALIGRSIPFRSAIGYALYPQDVEGAAFGKPGAEQARLFLRKARMAAAFSAEKRGREAVSPVLGFGRILAEGGRVAEVHTLSRLTVTLGRNMNAREGQRFSVWSPTAGSQDAPPVYKGEIVLTEVREQSSVAEIIHVGDPTWEILPGDALTLLPDDAAGPRRLSEGQEKRDPLTGLLRHGDFLAAWTSRRESCDAFTLALLRLDPLAGQTAEESPGSEHLVTEAVRLVTDSFGQELLGGRYGLNSLIFFHPDSAADQVASGYQKICAELLSRFFSNQSQSVGAACGLAGYPFLRARKAEILENCLKALDYALLLPSPHVGLTDSLALTISADKRFSKGDIFGAVEEYKQALAADPDNVMAWNSLGVSLAGQGRHQEAHRCFSEALARNADDVMALYNRAHSSQCLGDFAEASENFRRCLDLDSDHVYAHLRLGQLAEIREDYPTARAHYEGARKAGAPEALVLRHMAALALALGDRQEARELLHETLNRDPRNAQALYLMARLYLDEGEDAEVAETLARQSVAIRPDAKPAWLELARAMEARGKTREARDLLIKAASLY